MTTLIQPTFINKDQVKRIILENLTLHNVAIPLAPIIKVKTDYELYSVPYAIY